MLEFVSAATRRHVRKCESKKQLKQEKRASKSKPTKKVGIEPLKLNNITSLFVRLKHHTLAHEENRWHFFHLTQREPVWIERMNHNRTD